MGLFRALRHGAARATVAAVAAADATMFGATQSPSTVVAGYRSPILALRKQFDLYANLRPTATLLPGQPAVDLLIVRENTEGLYSGREHRDGDTAIAERVITRAASERIARVAFEQARRRSTQANHAAARSLPMGRITQHVSRSTHVTIVHKANVLKLTDGLFRECCLAVAAEYPDVEVNEMLVDAAAMWLVKDPSRFDVIVTTNLFGDILSDLAAGLVGGLGVAPSANVGAGQVAVFEPVHGSAPDIAGRGLANPIGAILSAALLLEHLGDGESAGRVATRRRRDGRRRDRHRRSGRSRKHARSHRRDLPAAALRSVRVGFLYERAKIHHQDTKTRRRTKKTGVFVCLRVHSCPLW